MRVLVCGSRDWVDALAIANRLAELPRDAVVIHGGARGADDMADRFAAARDLRCERFPADWKLHGKRAGFERNLQMLDTKPDLVIAFQVDASRGTQHTIDEARKRGIPVEVHTA